MSDWLEAEQRVERAQQLSESACWEEALAELDIAVSINPHNALWHAQRGFLLEELDRHAEAAEAYERSLQIEPGECDVCMALANVLLREGRYRRALAVLDEISKRDPSFEPAYCYRIQAYAELGLHEKAEEMFYLAQELDDACPNCFFFLGGSLAARGKFAHAIYCWNRTLEIAPVYDGVYRRIGQAYRTLGKLRQARAYFLYELREDPGNIDLLFELAEVALESGRPQQAMAKFQQILELDPQCHRARYGLASVLLQMGKAESALKCFTRLESDDPDYVETADTCRQIGAAHLQAGQLDEALSKLERSVGMSPDDLETWALLGDCYLLHRRIEEAVACFERILAADRSNSDVQFRLGVCLASLGRASAAVQHFGAALLLRPDLEEAKCAKAQAHVTLRQWSQAREVLATAVSPEACRLRKSIWRSRLRTILPWV